MKDKLVIIIVGSILIVVSICCGFWVGDSYGFIRGNTTGYGQGLERGNYVSYEKGYSTGYDNGKEYVVTHLDQYVTVPKAVSYDKVAAFLKSDQTDKNEYTDENDCVTFSKLVKENANSQGIRCGVVSLDLKGTKNIGHAINAFETTDRGIVYFDPQTDGERYDIRVGGTYKLSGLYKITKVDIIW